MYGENGALINCETLKVCLWYVYGFMCVVTLGLSVYRINVGFIPRSHKATFREHSETHSQNVVKHLNSCQTGNK